MHGKHYPGHGNTATDSHTSLPIINITKDELFINELSHSNMLVKII